MYGLFEHLSQYDEGQRVASRQAAAVAQKRIADRMGAFLKVAKDAEDYSARLDFVQEDVRQIVADVAEEYGADTERLQQAIDKHLEENGDGITNLNEELEGAPSAVGEKASAAGNGHRSDCNCGFCSSAGSFGNQEVESEEEPSAVEASTKQAEAPKDGGGAVKRESLPTGDGKAVGDGPSPKIDKREWKPNALNENGNLSPVDTEMDGSPVPTVEQDVTDGPEYETQSKEDFLEQTDAVTESQDLPSADESGVGSDRNISQDGQGGTWAEAQGSPVTSSTDPDVNPLKAILDAGFTPDTQVDAAIQGFESE